MNRTSWIVFSIVTIGILVMLVVFSNNQSSTDVSKIDPIAVQSANTQNGNIADHIAGSGTGKVTIIEYGDYECPGCGRINPTIESLIHNYDGKVRFIFRNYPLTTIHTDAMAAAGATEAAGLQGKFWEMHNKIYNNQSDWDSLSNSDLTNKFVSYAKALGLNTTKFKDDMASDSVSKKIAYDQALGNKMKLESTPTFYLNGKLLESSTWGDKAKFAAAIDVELKKVGVTPPTNE